MLPKNVHPDYINNYEDWNKYRLTYKGGRDFIDYYLTKYSARELDADFHLRRQISYCPAHAKAAVNDIKNSIFQRLVDITRIGGPKSFYDAATGANPDGVDLRGNNMNSFIGRIVLPELLTMAKVGVYIDRPDVEIRTRRDQFDNRPYLYHYRAEDILNWRYEGAKLVELLLRDKDYASDVLPSEVITKQRHIILKDDGVHVTVDDDTTIIKLPEIPFVLFDINSSLLTDAADYQIALLNLASSDMHYILKANFPFFTEQYDPKVDAIQTGKKAEANVGPTTGRRYPVGTERPEFIAPPTDPMKLSLQKQESMQDEIRRLVNLNVSNVEPRKQSAESKAYDQQGLEAGLSYIGLELEFGERKIAQIWAMYESTLPTTINYPEHYSLKTDADRMAEADKLEESADKSISMTYRKLVAKEAARLRVGHKVTADTMKLIESEINSTNIVVFDLEAVHKDIEAGLLSPETASSKIRLYPVNEYEKASVAHADRLARIAIAQSEGAGAGATRGVADTQESPTINNRQEKATSRDTTNDGTPTDKTRGDEQ